MQQAALVKTDGAQAAHQALVKVMEGLAGILLLFGVRWPEAQQALKAGYYHAAEKSLKEQGKKPSQRRIYIKKVVFHLKASARFVTVQLINSILRTKPR